MDTDRPVKRGDRGRFLPGTRPGPGRPPRPPPAIDIDDNPHPILSTAWFKWQLERLERTAKHDVDDQPAHPDQTA